MRAFPGPVALSLAAAGVAWRAYMGGMPSACFAGAEAGDYAKKHNPFMYLPSVASNPSLCARDVPETQLNSDLPNRLLAVTFDEGTTNAGCCGNAAGGRIATVLLGPKVTEGARLHGAYPHYSLLATIEDRYGLPRLRNARSAAAIDLSGRS